MQIVELIEFSEADFGAMAALMTELSGDDAPSSSGTALPSGTSSPSGTALPSGTSSPSARIVLTRESLERLLSDPGSHLYVCREEASASAFSAAASSADAAPSAVMLNSFQHLRSRVKPGMTPVTSAPGRIVGCACLCVYHQPFETDASIESVVVSSAVRGRGVGRLLVQHLIDEARRLGVQQLHLTSRPSRVAANALYRRLGFQPKETNCYILDL